MSNQLEKPHNETFSAMQRKELRTNLKALLPGVEIDALEQAIEESINAGGTFGSRKHKSVTGRLKAALAWSKENPEKFRVAAKECLSLYGRPKNSAYTRSVTDPAKFLNTRLASIVSIDPEVMEDLVDAVIESGPVEPTSFELTHRIRLANKASFGINDAGLRQLALNLRSKMAQRDLNEFKKRRQVVLSRLDSPDMAMVRPQLAQVRDYLSKEPHPASSLGMDIQALRNMLAWIDLGAWELIPHLRTLIGQLLAEEASCLHALDSELFLAELGRRKLIQSSHITIIKSLADGEISPQAFIRQASSIVDAQAALKQLAVSDWTSFLALLQGVLRIGKQDSGHLHLNFGGSQSSEKLYSICPICGDKTRAGDRCRERCFEAD